MSENNFAAQSFNAYRRILAAGSEKFKTETGLGGLLFFAGPLTERARPLLVAANVSGSASLVVAEDAERGKQALRDGVVDFLVSSLDEALRILKNDLRKKQPTSVEVTAPLDEILAEMLERGVQPDLLDAEVFGAEKFLAHGARALPETSALPARSLIVMSGSASQLARVDSFWRENFAEEDSAMERWQRLSARYLGRLAQGVRVYGSDREFAEERVDALQDFIRSESIDVRFDGSQN